MPERIQMKRLKGWRMPPAAVKVDRSTIWGNPFVGDDAVAAYRAFWDTVVIGRRGPFILNAPGGIQIGPQVYRVQPYLRRDRIGLTWDQIDQLRLRLGELRGRDLCCWCSLNQPCHADVLLELANAKV